MNSTIIFDVRDGSVFRLYIGPLTFAFLVSVERLAQQDLFGAKLFFLLGIAMLALGAISKKRRPAFLKFYPSGRLEVITGLNGRTLVEVSKYSRVFAYSTISRFPVLLVELVDEDRKSSLRLAEFSSFSIRGAVILPVVAEKAMKYLEEKHGIKNDGYVGRRI